MLRSDRPSLPTKTSYQRGAADDTADVRLVLPSGDGRWTAGHVLTVDGDPSVRV